MTATAPAVAPSAPRLSNVRLYDLGSARDIIDQWLEESEGEWTPELEQLLNELDGDFDEKAERVALIVRELKASARTAKEERQRFFALEQSYGKAGEKLLDYLQREMVRYGHLKINRPRVKLSVCDNGGELPVVHYFTADQLATFHAEGQPWVRKTVTVSYTVDGDLIRDMVKRKEALPEGITAERGQHLRMK